MKEIIIGSTGSGKSRNYVAPAIQKYKGGVIYITRADDRDYLKIDDIVEKVDITCNGFQFLEGSKVFIECNSVDNIKIMSLIQKFIKPYLEMENLMIVIDESTYILGENLLDFLLHNVSSKADIMVVLQNDYFINEKLNKMSIIECCETKCLLESNWNIINVDKNV